MLGLVYFSLLFFATNRSQAETDSLYLSLSGGAAIPVGSLDSVVDVGGGVTAGLGYGFTENIAVEGEFVGAWAPISAFGVSGTASSYSGLFGPRLSLPLSEDGALGVFAGGGIGVLHREASVSGFGLSGFGSATNFGWQAKGGLQYAFAETLEIFVDARYVATSEAAGDGVVGVGLGIRFFPGN